MASQSVTIQRPEGRDCRKTFRDNVVGIVAGAGSAHVAFSIAAAYPSRIPHWQELSDRFGMNRATAYRYLGALKAVRGQF